MIKFLRLRQEVKIPAASVSADAAVVGSLEIPGVSFRTCQVVRSIDQQKTSKKNHVLAAMGGFMARLLCGNNKLWTVFFL